MLAAMSGCCIWSSRNRVPNMLHTVDGDETVTVAVCRVPCSSAISPK